MSAVKEAVAGRLGDTRRRTLELFAPLPHEHLVAQPCGILSPPLWDLGHIAAYEELWIAGRVAGRPSLHPDLLAVYDAAETPRAERGDAPILSEDDARAYLGAVRDVSLAVLDAADLDAGDPLLGDGFVFDLAAQHEAQHAETVLQAFQMLPAGAYRPAAPSPAPEVAAPVAGDPWIEVPGGSFAMGAADGGFAYDCERPRHERGVAPFRIARDPVTNAAWLAFMADDGYGRPELWSEEGWRWRLGERAEAPLYWERDGEGGWLARAFDRRDPVDPALPVCHVSAHEADAHARWAGARLPTEPEWERAAAGAPSGPGQATLGATAFAPAPAGAAAAAPSGCRGMLGDVWEWTASPFTGYPGFRAFPYREYAEVFFGPSYRVLRGGSWATQPVAARPTFRNWDLPQRRQIFAGLRLAADAA
ncbi:MAG: ergothioneine biosynthesis protein EgtB [Thermoleophilia bacterium]